MLREVGKLAAPLDAPGVRFQPGTTVRVDAVVRTRKIGHFFPGGTVDAFDVWLEFKARDARGRVLAWSGTRRGQRPRPGGPGRAFLPLLSSSTAKATPSTSAMPGRPAACSTCG